MNRTLSILTAAILVLIAGMGCRALLQNTPGPSNPLVTSGVATTNDPNLVAVLKEIQRVNQVANPTPTELPLNQALGAMIALTSAAAGWFGRHATTPPKPTSTA